MDWETIKTEYLNRIEEEKKRGIDIIRGQYEEIINNLSDEDREKLNDGELPAELLKIVEIDPTTGHFMCKQYPEYEIGSILDIIEEPEVYHNEDD